MLYAILCYDSEDVVGSWTKEEDDAVMAKLGGRAAEARRAGQARPGRPADADHRGDHAQEGPRAAGHRRPVRRDQGAAARLLHGRLRDPRGGDRGRHGSGARQRLGRAPTRFARSPMFRPGSRRDVTDIAWIDAALTSARPQAVGALLRYFRDLDTRRGGVPGSLPAGAQELAAERPAARSRRLAHLRRAQRRDRRGAAPQASRKRCRPTSVISDLDDAESGARRAARRRALSRRHPAPPVHLLPSRSAGDAADRARAAHRLAAFRSSRSRAPSW